MLGISKQLVTPTALSRSTSKNFFTGSYNTNKDNLDALDPYLTGFAFIFWIDVPDFMNKIFPGNIFENFTQKNFNSLGGLSDMDLQTANITSGFGANEIQFAGSIQKGNNTFTLKHQEFSGSPVSTLYRSWVECIRDPETNTALYPKLFDMDYTAKNHTGTLLYVVTRPDANNVEKNIVQFSSLWTNVFPKRIPLGHYNFDKGSSDQVEIEIEFSGDFHMNSAIDKLANEQLKKAYAFKPLGLYSTENGKYKTDSLTDTVENISDSWANFRDNITSASNSTSTGKK